MHEINLESVLPVEQSHQLPVFQWVILKLTLSSVLKLLFPLFQQDLNIILWARNSLHVLLDKSPLVVKESNPLLVLAAVPNLNLNEQVVEEHPLHHPLPL